MSLLDRLHTFANVENMTVQHTHRNSALYVWFLNSYHLEYKEMLVVWCVSKLDCEQK